ncbi:MAG: hypothetical protein A2156_16120 [Deltaproteobacteria bacterium RBG_16_48_10]|nr:MAG: hypothetical protein A2156_16120 [Deltaproteobacteria bacterium RBG_16_48_10]
MTTVSDSAKYTPEGVIGSYSISSKFPCFLVRVRGAEKRTFQWQPLIKSWQRAPPEKGQREFPKAFPQKKLYVFRNFKRSEDQWVRKNACEALIQIGPVAAMHLLKELERQQTSVETTCDILRVLGEIKSEQWKAPLSKVLRQYVSHDRPRLREQALHSLCQIEGLGGEETFLRSLNDPDLEVRKRAVWCLGMTKSLRGLDRMMEMISQISTSSSPQLEQLETQIYHALGISGNLAIGGRTIEQLLLDVLEKRGLKQWWNPFQKNLLNESSLGAICDALGKIGTKESFKILGRLAKARDISWAPKAKEAFKRVEDRINLSKS